MAEPTVQVPVSLIERLHRTAEVRDDDLLELAAALRSQSTSTAEPMGSLDAKLDALGLRDTDEPTRPDSLPFPHAKADRMLSEPPRIEDMAPGTTEDAIRADEREQWASYFDNADASVGSPPLAYAMVVKYLRGPKPFGVAQGDPSTIRDVTPPTVTE